MRVFPLPNHRLEVLELLRSVQGPSLAQQGCLACRLYVEEGAEQAILFCQSWESEADLLAHLRPPLYHRVLAAIELSGDPPEIGFHQVASTQGMELIEHERGFHGDPTVP